MMRAAKYLTLRVAGLFAVAALVGCGGEPPQADLDAAQAALATAEAAEAEKYAGSDLSAAQKAFADAKTAFDAEAEKMLFKDWESVVPQIADAKSKADMARSSAEAAKAAAMAAAESAIADASVVIQGVRASLEAAPAGKGTEGDVEQLRADLDAADADLSAARAAVSSEDFEMATSKAGSAKMAAEAVSEGVDAAVARYHQLVEERTPWYERGMGG